MGGKSWFGGSCVRDHHKATVECNAEQHGLHLCNFRHKLLMFVICAWKGDSWRAWYLCSRCEGLSYERGSIFALRVSWSTQLWCSTENMIERGICMIFLPMWILGFRDREGAFYLVILQIDLLIPHQLVGKGKISGGWVGKWTQFRRTSSCWAGSTSEAASGTWDRWGSTKVGITVHGG